MEDNPVLSEFAYNGIKGLITSGEIPPLGRLVETELAARLKVSRAPVREALRSLEHEGIVKSVPRWGSYVRQLTAEELVEVWELREVLDGLACRLLAKRISPEQVNQLQDLCLRYRSAAESGDEAACDEIDVKFHRCIAQWSGNGRLVKILDVFEVLSKSVVPTNFAREDLLQIAGGHEALVALLAAGKAAQAENLARRHIGLVARVHRQSLQDMAATAVSFAEENAQPRIRRRTKTRAAV